MQIEQDFKQQMLTKIIPKFERMIVKETQHILELNIAIDRISSDSKFPEKDQNLILLKDWLNSSKFYLNHYNSRLLEYQEFVKDKNHKILTETTSYTFFKEVEISNDWYIRITSTNPKYPIYQWKIGYETNDDTCYFFDTKLDQKLISELETEYQESIKL